MRLLLTAVLALLLPTLGLAQNKQGHRLAYLDEVDLYYPSHSFPKLVTPQWIGEPGVEAVVILAIDDMRDPKRYEKYLRPILKRLQEIDGRAPVSIMTNQIKPDDPHLQTWLKEGLSLDCHTFDHPCPYFRIGFDKAKVTYERCIDMMNEIPNNQAVAFRMPCCDSLNTPSPRFNAEIFNKATEKGGFLSIDSSVFMVYTSADPELPRELVLNKDGKERFKRYFPPDRSFVNYIENYPYPYAIGKLCWQFPCMTPSDWQANHVQKPNNPQTVQDWKAAIDCTVIKQGVFTMVFHPHGWIRNEQIVELIDHAVQKHGKKVKFLTFKEALERLNKNLLAGQPLRHPKTGADNGVRLLDVNHDGYLDVVLADSQVRKTRKWSAKKQQWLESNFPQINGLFDNSAQFGILRPNGLASVVSRTRSLPMGIDRIFHTTWHFDGEKWVKDTDASHTILLDSPKVLGETDFLLRDVDGDGICEILPATGSLRGVGKTKNKLSLTATSGIGGNVFGYWDSGVRLVDLDQDGKLDLLFSNEKEYGIYLFTDLQKGWSRKVMAGKAGEKNSLPPIARHGTNNGFWVHSGHLWWSNEDTALLKDHVDRRLIRELLGEAASPK